MGMFWLNPKHYIAFDANNRELFERSGINGEIKNLAMYLQLIKQVNEKLGTSYPQISRDAVKSPNKADRQYWAGGFQWGKVSKLEEFIQGNFWQIGWDKEEQKPAAKKTWDYFEQVRVGDEFAIKGLGGAIRPSRSLCRRGNWQGGERCSQAAEARSHVIQRQRAWWSNRSDVV
jgi:hypothetical protein